jgi:heme-degrading monooxygenase HmoA
MAVDLSAYPDLVVIYLGMRVEEPRGYETLQRLGPQIQASVEEQPDGLLLHENLSYSEEPLHVGMRQYWRDLDALEAWSRTLPHKAWWSEYLRDRGGTSFWHETYFRRGGIETMFVDTGETIGLARVAPAVRAEGPMFAARARAEADRAAVQATS